MDSLCWPKIELYSIFWLMVFWTCKKLNKKGAVMKNENETGITFVVMPLEVLQNKELNSSEKILYCYLSLFKKGVCFQSNDKLSEMTGLDVSTIKRGLKKLSELKFVYIEFVNNNSAARRIYVVLDNPKKLAYLASKGAFNEAVKAKKVDDAPAEKEEPVRENTAPNVAPKPRGLRPSRNEYENQEDFEKAFYEWNRAVI